MRLHFNDLFSNNNGSISPKAVIQIGGIIMSPGVSFGSGVSMGGINLSEHTNSYFEVEVDHQRGVNVITQIYNW